MSDGMYEAFASRDSVASSNEGISTFHVNKHVHVTWYRGDKVVCITNKKEGSHVSLKVATLKKILKALKTT